MRVTQTGCRRDGKWKWKSSECVTEATSIVTKMPPSIPSPLTAYPRASQHLSSPARPCPPPTAHRSQPRPEAPCTPRPAQRSPLSLRLQASRHPATQPCPGRGSGCAATPRSEGEPGAGRHVGSASRKRGRDCSCRPRRGRAALPPSLRPRHRLKVASSPRAHQRLFQPKPSTPSRSLGHGFQLKHRWLRGKGEHVAWPLFTAEAETAQADCFPGLRGAKLHPPADSRREGARGA